MSDTLNPTPVSPETDSNPMREIRAALDAQKAETRKANEEKASLESRLKEIERAKLEENERLKLELADRDKAIETLKPYQEKVQTFETKAQADYESELATIPEDKRDLLRSLSSKGTAFESLDALRQAKTLLGTPAPPVVRTNGQPAPTTPTVTGPDAKPFDPKDPYGGAFKS